MGDIMKRKVTLILAIITLLAIILMTSHPQALHNMRFIDLTDYVERLKSGEELSDEDLLTISKQTGLGKDSIRTLTLTKRLNEIYDYQNDYLKNQKYYKSHFVLVSYEELLYESHLPFVNIRTGDVILTSSSVTGFFRHGHAGIVINGPSGETVEAYSPLENSCISNVNTWLEYRAVMVLRLKPEYAHLADQAAKYAEENLVDVKYSLFSSTKDSTDNVKRTQCAQLVYLAFKYVGLEIDQNGDWLITAKEISKSKYFYTVEVKGFDFVKGWE